MPIPGESIPSQKPKPPQEAVSSIIFPDRKSPDAETQPIIRKVNIEEFINSELSELELEIGVTPESKEKFKQSRFYEELQKLPENIRIKFESDLYSEISDFLISIDDLPYNLESEENKKALFKGILYNLIPNYQNFENLEEAKDSILTYFKFNQKFRIGLEDPIQLNYIPHDILKKLTDSEKVDPEMGDWVMRQAYNAKTNLNENLVSNLSTLYTKSLKDTESELEVITMPGLFEILSDYSSEECNEITDRLAVLLRKGNFDRTTNLLTKHPGYQSSIEEPIPGMIEKIRNIEQLKENIKQNSTSNDEDRAKFTSLLNDVLFKLNDQVEFKLSPQILDLIKNYDLTTLNNTDIYDSYISKNKNLVNLIHNQEDLELFLSKVMASKLILDHTNENLERYKNLDLKTIVEFSETEYANDSNFGAGFNLLAYERKAEYIKPLLEKGYDKNFSLLMLDYLKREDLENLENISDESKINLLLNRVFTTEDEIKPVDFKTAVNLIKSINKYSAGFYETLSEEQKDKINNLQRDLLLNSKFEREFDMAKYGEFLKDADLETVSSIRGLFHKDKPLLEELLDRHKKGLIDGVISEEKSVNIFRDKVSKVSKIIDVLKIEHIGESDLEIIEYLIKFNLAEDLSEVNIKNEVITADRLLLKILTTETDMKLNRELALKLIPRISDMSIFKDLLQSKPEFASIFIDTLEAPRTTVKETESKTSQVGDFYSVLSSLNLDPEAKKDILYKLNYWGFSGTPEDAELKAKFFSEVIPGSIYESFYQLDKIPSTELRNLAKKAALEHIRKMAATKALSKEELFNFAKDRKNQAIPKEMILVFEALFNRDSENGESEKDKIEAYNQIYSRNLSLNAREAINNFIINKTKMDTYLAKKDLIHNLVLSKLVANISNLNKENSKSLAAVYSYLQILHNIPNEIDGLMQQVESWDGKDLNVILKIFENYSASQMTEMFNGELNPEAVQQFNDLYQRLDIPLVYAGGGDDNCDKKYFARILNSISSQDIRKWKDFKYRNIETNPNFSGFSEDQINTWRTNHIFLNRNAEIRKYIDSPKLIFDNLISKVRSYEPIGPLTVMEQRVHQVVIDAFKKVPEFNTDEYYVFINQNIVKIETELDTLNACIDKKTLVTDLEFNINKYKRGGEIKLDNIQGDIDRLSRYLSPEDLAEIKKNIQNLTLLGNKKCQAEDLIPESIYLNMQERLKTNSEKVNNAIQKVKDLYGLDPESKEFIKNVRGIREDILVPYYLFQLSAITPELIADNSLSEKLGIKLDEAVDKINKYFQSTGLDNVISEVKQKSQESEVENTELLMVLTDSPLLSIVAGKYPLGCGSCQNYESGSYRQTLLGYVGDSHSKVAIGLDTKKLPSEVLELIKEKGIDNIDFERYAKDIFEAIVCRSTIKLGASEDQKPVVYIENVYTTANKGNHAFDQSMYELITNVFSKEKGFTVASYHGFQVETTETSVNNIAISIPASENSFGQYEDAPTSRSGNRPKEEYTIIGNRI